MGVVFYVCWKRFTAVRQGLKRFAVFLHCFSSASRTGFSGSAAPCPAGEDCIEAPAGAFCGGACFFSRLAKSLRRKALTASKEMKNAPASVLIRPCSSTSALPGTDLPAPAGYMPPFLLTAPAPKALCPPAGETPSVGLSFRRRIALCLRPFSG